MTAHALKLSLGMLFGISNILSLGGVTLEHICKKKKKLKKCRWPWIYKKKKKKIEKKARAKNSLLKKSICLSK